jgi:hypothetical protein
MKRQYHRIGRVLSIWAMIVWPVVLGMSIGTQAFAQNAPSFHRRLMPEPILQHMTKGLRPGSNARKASQARRLALERCQFLKRLEPKIGYIPLNTVIGNTIDTVLFPIGRSDRVYIVLWEEYKVFGTSSSGDGFNMILCYQHTERQDKLVYKISLEPVDRPAKKIAQIESLLDYINASGNVGGGYAIKGKISNFALKDLALKRDYVQYSYDSFSEVLGVGLLSQVKNGSVLSDPETNYDTGDPVNDPFYRKYGLPVAKEEFQKRVSK